MPTFAELLTKHIENAGITDKRLAESIGVTRQTIFRWKEGLTERPRNRDGILACADKLRLNYDEKNELLLAAGCRPLDLPEAPITPILPIPDAARKEPEQYPGDSEESLEQDEEVDGIFTESSNAQSDESVASITGDDNREQVFETDAPPFWRHFLTWPGVVLLPLCLLAIVTLATLSFQSPLSPIVTPSPTSTAAPKPSPTATSVPILATENETLILVSKFIGQGYRVNNRVLEALASEIEATELLSTSVELWTGTTVEDETQAQTILKATQAAMLIHGEYDLGRVRVNLSIRDNDATLDWERLLNSPAELTPVINYDVPAESRILALFSLGRLYRNEGDYDSARRVFEQALELEPEEINTKASLYFYLGYVSERGAVSDIPLAIQYYSDVLHLKPAWINARYNRGTAYRNLAYGTNDLDVAENYLDKAIQDLSQVLAAKKTVPAYLNRGIAYYERQKIDDLAKAVADFDAAQHLSEDDYRIYFNRGLARIRANDPAWAEDIRQSLDLRPEYAPIYNALCWGHALDGAIETALPDCNQAIELGDTGNSRDGRGLVYAQQGRLAEAKTEFQAYLEWLNTKYPDLYERYQGPLIETWITVLEKGENPITPETLEELR